MHAAPSPARTSKYYISNVYDLYNFLVLLSQDSFLTARNFAQSLFVPRIAFRLPFSSMDWNGRSRTDEPPVFRAENLNSLVICPGITKGESRTTFQVSALDMVSIPEI
jgi:hypothetical protein